MKTRVFGRIISLKNDLLQKTGLEQAFREIDGGGG